MPPSFPQARTAIGSRPSSAHPVQDRRDRGRRQATNSGFRNGRRGPDIKGKEDYEIITEKDAPVGYLHIPLGTDDLSSRCRELSKQRGKLFYTVNAHRHGLAPQSVSYHLQRTGYHFANDIVEQASSELGYMPHEGKFHKMQDIRAQQQTRHIADLLGQNGRLDEMQQFLEANEHQKEVASARRVIKEMFRKIPEADLDDIMNRAWKQGSDRVGTSKDLPLQRKAQLAVVARIRHTYTDYDILLRPLGWERARALVESECIKKLIEWRGEGMEDDDMVTFIKDVIVIDDDDDDDVIYSGQRPVDRSASRPATQRLVGDADRATDSVDERIERKRNLKLQDSAKHQEFARELLQDARRGLQKDRDTGTKKQSKGQHRGGRKSLPKKPSDEALASRDINGAMRNATVNQESPAPHDRAHVPGGVQSEHPRRIMVQANDNGETANEVVLGGVRYVKVPPAQPQGRYVPEIDGVLRMQPQNMAPPTVPFPGHLRGTHNATTPFTHDTSRGYGEVMDLTVPEYVDLTTPPKPRALYTVNAYDVGPPSMHASLRDVQTSARVGNQAQPRYKPAVQDSVTYDPQNPFMLPPRVAQSEPQSNLNYTPRFRSENVDPRPSTPNFAPMHGAPAPVQQVPRESSVRMVHRFPDGTIAPVHAGLPYGSPHHVSPAPPPFVNGAPAPTQYYRHG